MLTWGRGAANLDAGCPTRAWANFTPVGSSMAAAAVAAVAVACCVQYTGADTVRMQPFCAQYTVHIHTHARTPARPHTVHAQGLSASTPRRARQQPGCLDAETLWIRLIQARLSIGIHHRCLRPTRASLVAIAAAKHLHAQQWAGGLDCRLQWATYTHAGLYSALSRGRASRPVYTCATTDCAVDVRWPRPITSCLLASDASMVRNVHACKIPSSALDGPSHAAKRGRRKNVHHAFSIAHKCRCTVWIM